MLSLGGYYHAPFVICIYIHFFRASWATNKIQYILSHQITWQHLPAKDNRSVRIFWGAQIFWQPQQSLAVPFSSRNFLKVLLPLKWTQNVFGKENKKHPTPWAKRFEFLMWKLAVSWIQEPWSRIQDPGSWTQDPKPMHDARFLKYAVCAYVLSEIWRAGDLKNSDYGSNISVSGRSWIWDPGSILYPASRMQEPWSRIQDPGSRILDPRSRILGSWSMHSAHMFFYKFEGLGLWKFQFW